MASVEVRKELVQALQLDLIGPSNDHAFARELLPEPPSRWYLTGVLVPTDAPIEQRTDETSTDEIDSGGDTEGTDDAAEPDRAAARRSILPSSMGLSMLVPADVENLQVQVSWGDYAFEDNRALPEPGESDLQATQHETDEPGEGEVTGGADPTDKASSGEGGKRRRGWQRTPRDEQVIIRLTGSGGRPVEFPVPGSEGLSLAVTVRLVGPQALGAGRLPAGTRSVSVFLVNRRRPNEEHPYRAFAFQASLRIESPRPFVPRPDLRGCEGDHITDEWDEQVADLQFRDICEYAVGHGVSAQSERASDGSCTRVRTTWMPLAEVERVETSPIPDVELGMEALGALADGADAKEKLEPLVTHYRAWIAAQGQKLQGLDQNRTRTGRDLLSQAEYVARRMEAGIGLLADSSQPVVLDAFRIANRAMAQTARQRAALQQQMDPPQVASPKWRPFQLAFILMTLRGIVDPRHTEREAVDLLFFPTGGGKTEAYLGLAAFTMVLRRLRNPGIRSAGMSVLMRYTLRLLTLDQLGRAASLMCALELERDKELDPQTGKKRLGDWPFEIGLWVGQAATPNRMGKRGDNSSNREYTAYTKTMRFQRDDRSNPSPIPIEECPWCGTKFRKDSFRLVPNPINPRDLRVHCSNHRCLFTGDRCLPIVAVDEPIYRRLPAFLIATVDKFASLPWTGECGTLFGNVDRYDNEGFYGPCNGGQGHPLDAPLPPPELIIQDELHLISGPLGTIAGVYEAAIDALASRTVDGRVIRPKIVASTATVRRAERQIRSLFDRQAVTVFPAPGPDRRDSFFARTLTPAQSPARMYVGVAAQGRSLKVVLLRSALALLSAGQVAYAQAGGDTNHQNPADPYMTLLGYFNSLRELGGSRRIIEDEVRTRLAGYARRRRRDPADATFANRDIQYDVLELTSRVPTNKVADAKRRLALPFHTNEHVDVALATNMISVGLDIIRLGLMVVLGQPKTSAEYIQATSRVGRDPTRPGLVVTLLNVHKPRDRSHYERFETYHASFYRSVEVTSVTPYSPRALDRALPAALVGLCRHGLKEMTPPLGANRILDLRAALTDFARCVAERAGRWAGPVQAEAQRVRDHVLVRCESLLDDWLNIATELRQTNTTLQYHKENTLGARLLYEFLHPDLPQLPELRRRFRANRSMRDVEPSVDLFVKNLNDWGDKR